MKDKLLAVWASIKAFFVKYNVLLFVVGALILVAKYRDIVMNLITFGGKEEFNKAQSTDAALSKQENTDETSATNLEQKAAQEGQDLPPVNQDWNKQ